MFEPYHKIDTIFQRNTDKSLIVDSLTRNVLRTLDAWSVEEKIDGTNIRIIFVDGHPVRVRGRENGGQICTTLLEYCLDKAYAILPQVNEIKGRYNLTEYTLFGEGVGPGVTEKYGPDPNFILFDVCVGDGTFLAPAVVENTALKLGLTRAPVLGLMSLDEIHKLVENGFYSLINPAVQAEGIVAKPLEPLYTNRERGDTGHRARLICKLKTSDFAQVPGTLTA